MATMTVLLHAIASPPSYPNTTKNAELNPCNLSSSSSFKPYSLSSVCKNLSLHAGRRRKCNTKLLLACLPSSPSSTRLYVSGLSFRTTQESLRNAFQNFGQLKEVNLVMDKVANRPRGFAFLRYATEEESKKAIEGMHGKFLDGRVIFVEVAKPRSEHRKGVKQTGD